MDIEVFNQIKANLPTSEMPTRLCLPYLVLSSLLMSRYFSSGVKSGGVCLWASNANLKTKCTISTPTQCKSRDLALFFHFLNVNATTPNTSDTSYAFNYIWNST